MLNRAEVSVISPVNDAESKPIVDICTRLGVDVRISAQPWGCTLASSRWHPWLGYDLTRWEKGVAINDRAYIFGLLGAGYNKEEVLALRRFDLETQGVPPEKIEVVKIAIGKPQGHRAHGREAHRKKNSNFTSRR